MMEDERGFTLWEICLCFMILSGWIVLVTPFILRGNEQIVRLEKTVQTFERLQGEVLREAEHPSGVEEVCEAGHCLPTL